MVATSATRDARNRDDFFAMTAVELGRCRLGCACRGDHRPGGGAAVVRRCGRGIAQAEGPFMVVDLGGGSTEVVLGDETGVATYSADIGCVRLTERYLHTNPPTADEVAAARTCFANGWRGTRCRARGTRAHLGRRGRHDDDGRGGRAEPDRIRFGDGASVAESG